jgi:hypothetical protein
MTTAPMRYLVLAFPDGNISDEIAPELADLVDKRIIRILDIVFVAKDAAGDVSILEFDELGNLVGFAETDGEVDGQIGPDDLDLVGSELEPGAAAAVLLAGARVPGDLLLAEITELGAAPSSTRVR